ncbi:YggS family pyridoxal phosphate-dependent enzyme [Alicyclobacillus dauci]|uniref:Pyridoxal phosphate homeostasis protein n=1 Tax=Alicyclobacillus dauci TaxID=1475485 RepID=A0ABY6YY70_9BACL|nr:YggS family pyridoxal phosphate-dependent enzyme [Alicyclobacillus dauci]WAH35521.1 YggS family pyridoxal phosphate-dependent enzyme [Alicyclobacillus dauci]
MDTFIAENLAWIQAEISRAANSAQRNSEDVRIIAVTKTAESDILPLLIQAGIRDAAENRWQVAREKFQHGAAADLQWHFIGSLQTNKVKYVVPHFSWIHSVDRMELASAISHEAVKRNRHVSLLLQVNIAEEAQKHGLRVDEVLSVAEQVVTLPNVMLRGLMTMAPLCENPDDTRPVFRALRDLQRDLQMKMSLEDFDQLSMGMSQDFRIAVEEGSTMVRIGRRLVQPFSEQAEGGH